MLRLKPYNINDADIILSWSKDEIAFYKWSAGILGKYPITKEKFGFVNNLMAFTAIEDDKRVIGQNVLVVNPKNKQEMNRIYVILTTQ